MSGLALACFVVAGLATAAIVASLCWPNHKS